MNLLISDAYAQGAGAAPGGSFAPLLMMVVFIVIFYFLLIRPQQKKAKEHQAMLAKIAAIFGIFYFLMIRPQQKRQKEHKEMVAKMAVGDEVVTGGGVLGKVIEAGEQFITVEIADGVRIKVQRFQVTSLVPKGTLKSA